MCLPTSSNSVNDHEDASVSGHEDSLVNAQVNDVRRESASLQRKILGSWKQYSGRKFSGFFPVDSDNFQCSPRGSFWKSSEKIRKIPGGNTASMFQIFPVFSCRIR